MAPVPLRPERGFRLSAADVEVRLTAASRAILLNTPHNPTGAVLTRDDIRAIGALATAHDLWIVSDEVYEELVFDERRLPSPFAEPTIADRTVAISSISKSHAATGFRSGWAVASRETAEALLPLSETMLFGNQPFIADMTAAALSGPPDAAAELRRRFSRRAALLTDRLGGGALRVHPPEAGMFALVDIRATGMGSETYAEDLLETRGVAVMPGTSFGQTLEGWARVALTAPDEILACACDRMAAHAAALRAPA
jgi:arginine:pyruvate transaminase